jgi:hypothetical protein
MRTVPSAAFLTSVLALACAESVRAAHPFVTDDTGTQDAGNWQLELLAQHDRHDHVADTGAGPVRQRSRATSLNPVLTCGLLESLDLAVGLNRERYDDTQNGITVAEASGTADSTLELKWRFYEANGSSLAVKSGLELPTGDENRGLGSGRWSWSAVLIAAWETGPWTWLGNLSYARQRFALPQDAADNRAHLWRVSGGAAYAVRDDLRLVGEIGIRTNPARNDPFLPGGSARFALAGVIYSPSERVDLDLGVRKGLNRAEPDTALLAGATFRW